MPLSYRQQSPDGVVEFLIGRDDKGFWVARGADGREGGVFVSRDAAMKFVQSARPRCHTIAKTASATMTLWK
jgi:hypothetical protein